MEKIRKTAVMRCEPFAFRVFRWSHWPKVPGSPMSNPGRPSDSSFQSENPLNAASRRKPLRKSFAGRSAAPSLDLHTVTV